MGSTLIFQFLYINVLNYRYFHTDCSTFSKIKTFENKKNVKNARDFIENKKNVYKRLLYYNGLGLLARVD